MADGDEKSEAMPVSEAILGTHPVGHEEHGAAIQITQFVDTGKVGQALPPRWFQRRGSDSQKPKHGLAKRADLSERRLKGETERSSRLEHHPRHTCGGWQQIC